MSLRKITKTKPAPLMGILTDSPRGLLLFTKMLAH